MTCFFTSLREATSDIYLRVVSVTDWTTNSLVWLSDFGTDLLVNLTVLILFTYNEITIDWLTYSMPNWLTQIGWFTHFFLAQRNVWRPNWVTDWLIVYEGRVSSVTAKLLSDTIYCDDLDFTTTNRSVVLFSSEVIICFCILYFPITYRSERNSNIQYLVKVNKKWKKSVILLFFNSVLLPNPGYFWP